MRKIRIGSRWVGEHHPCFIIAEAGINHNGDIKIAKRMIDAAKRAGVDAVKFQTFKTKNLVTKNAKTAEHQTDSKGKSQYEILKSFELKEDDFVKLSKYAKEKGIMFLSSPFDRESVDLLEKLKVPAFKIASSEITNFPLLRYIARKRKPIILSTGMANLDEIREALDVIFNEGNKEVILLHCISAYPAKMEELNLRAIESLKRSFNLPVGFSDHTENILASLVAVAVGACVVEKHFTLDKNLPGPDHKFSLEPDELKEMVRTIRLVECSLGDGIKKPTKSEEKIKKFVRRSIVARTKITRGTIIKREMLDVKRPSGGIEPKYINAIIGKRAKRDIKEDEIITWDMIG